MLERSAVNARPFSDREVGWWLMATIQLAEDAPDLSEILADIDDGFRLRPAPCSPPGYRWLNLLVDSRRGWRRCAYTAHRLLGALQRIAEGGDLPGYGIIAGERWLEADSLERCAERDAAPTPSPGDEPRLS